MSVLTMRAVDLPSGETIPVLGMGTWHLAEGRHPPEVELDALRTGLDLGMTLIDTAELYGEGAGERLVGRAIAGRRDVGADQVLYNLTRRGIEWNLLPACQRIGLPIMAYSPIEQGRLAGHPVLKGIGRRHRATSTQVALSWVISHPGVCAIPQAGTPEHVRENGDALRVVLRQDDVVELDAAFPPPPHPVPLEVL